MATERLQTNYYSCERMSDRYWVITEGFSMVHRFTIGLFLGDDKALLIDAGLGVTGTALYDLVRRIVDQQSGGSVPRKPILCAVTCGNAEYIGSAGLFEAGRCVIRACRYLLSSIELAFAQTYTFAVFNINCW